MKMTKWLKNEKNILLLLKQNFRSKTPWYRILSHSSGMQNDALMYREVLKMKP